MKNKIITILVLIIMLFTNVSCSCKKDDGKTSLLVGDMLASGFRDISESTLDKMKADKENFVLFVYKVGCPGCERFKPILNKAIKERGLIVYGINIRNIRGNEDLFDAIQYTPSLVVYKAGKIKTMTDPIKDEVYFNDKDGVLSFFDKYMNMPTMYYISKEQLDEKIDNGENFVVYYSFDQCFDCSYFMSDFLKDYLKENYNSKRFYVVETGEEGIRFNNGEEDSEQWQKFKDDYGLSNVNNPLGHGVGYVPTMQYYENGVIVDMMVYFNDGEYIINDDGESFVVINNSYYEDNPYLGQTILYSEYRLSLKPFYNNKAKTFLDYNLKKVD